MGFDRTKLKAVPMNVLKEQDEEYEKVRPSKGFQDRVQHTIEEKVNNLFRLFPPHPEGGGKSFGENKCVSFLTVTRPKRNADGKVIEGETELKLFPIFNARVHGGLTKDPVEEYMKFAKEVVIPTLDTNKGNLIWEEIVGNFAKKLKGIKPKDSTVVYAVKKIKDGWGKVGTLEFPKSVKQQLMEEALRFSSGDVTTPDPYTHPDDGYAVNMTNSGEGATRYGVAIQTAMQKFDGTKKEIPVPVSVPLTPEQIDEWLKLEPLYKLFVNSYKRSDFDMQLEGLGNFDSYLGQKYNVEIIGPQLTDIFLEIGAQLSESDGENQANGPQDDVDDVPFTPDPPKKEPAPPRQQFAAKAPVPAPAPTPTGPSAPVPGSALDKLRAKYGKK